MSGGHAKNSESGPILTQGRDARSRSSRLALKLTEKSSGAVPPRRQAILAHRSSALFWRLLLRRVREFVVVSLGHLQVGIGGHALVVLVHLGRLHGFRDGAIAVACGALFDRLKVVRQVGPSSGVVRDGREDHDEDDDRNSGDGADYLAGSRLLHIGLRSHLKTERESAFFTPNGAVRTLGAALLTSDHDVLYELPPFRIRNCFCRQFGGGELVSYVRRVESMFSLKYLLRNK